MKRLAIHFVILFAAIGMTATGQSIATAAPVELQTMPTGTQHSQKRIANSATSGVTAAVAATPATVSAPTGGVVSAPTVITPRRNKPKPSAPGPYYVDFRARTAASYGHAFVWYGKTSEKMVEVAGLHPKGDELPYILGHLTWVPAETGASYGDLDEEYLTASYRVYLTEPEAKKVFAYIKEIQGTSKFWNAQTNNCTSFIGKIASFMGLKTPFHLIFPEQYVKSLKEMNGGRQTALLDDAQ